MISTSAKNEGKRKQSAKSANRMQMKGLNRSRKSPENPQKPQQKAVVHRAGLEPATF